MRDVQLKNGGGFTLRSKREANQWLGDGGMVYVWSDIPGALTHAELYIRRGGYTDVTMYDFMNHRVGDVQLYSGVALDFAIAYVRAAQK